MTTTMINKSEFNFFEAIGTIGSFTNVQSYSNERPMRIRSGRKGSFTTSDETCEVMSMLGNMKLMINDVPYFFGINIVKQPANFDNDGKTRWSVNAAYGRMKKFIEKFDKAQEEGKELRAKISGHIEDGTYYDVEKEKFVKQMKWVVTDITECRTGDDKCIATVNGMYYNNKIYIKQAAGQSRMGIRMLGKVKITGNDATKQAIQSGECFKANLKRVNVIDEDTGLIKRYVEITVAAPVHDNGKYGILSEEECEMYEDNREAFLERKKEKALR